MTLVLDASAMVAFLDAEDSGEVVRAALVEDEARAFAHALNVAEVFYGYHREYGEVDAQVALTRLMDSGRTAEKTRPTGGAGWPGTR